MIDHTDMAILKLLQENSRRQWKEIGEKVHLTGQAVASRVLALEESGVIKGFTIDLDNEKLGHMVTAFVTVFMSSANHIPFHRFLDNEPRILEAHRISGEGCYLLKATLTSHQELDQLLTNILHFGNYKVNISIGTIKTSVKCKSEKYIKDGMNEY